MLLEVNVFLSEGIALKQGTVWCLICFANKNNPDDSSALSNRTLFKLKLLKQNLQLVFSYNKHISLAAINARYNLYTY